MLFTSFKDRIKMLSMNKDIEISTKASQEIIQAPADADEISCDGGHPALGHPKVWYRFDGQPFVDCGYCGRRFMKAD